MGNGNWTTSDVLNWATIHGTMMYGTTSCQTSTDDGYYQVVSGHVTIRGRGRRDLKAAVVLPGTRLCTYRLRLYVARVGRKGRKSLMEPDLLVGTCFGVALVALHSRQATLRSALRTAAQPQQPSSRASHFDQSVIAIQWPISKCFSFLFLFS